MEELLNMDPEQLKAQMNDAMAMLTSADMQQNILDQKDDVLALMEAQVCSVKVGLRACSVFIT